MTKNVIAAIGTAAMLLISTACASTTPPRTPQPATTAPALPDSLLWVRDSAEYRAATLQTYRAATSSVTAAASGQTNRLVGGRARCRRDDHQQLAVSDRTREAPGSSTPPRAGARGSRVARPRQSPAPRHSSRAFASSAGASSSSPTGWSRSVRIPRRSSRPSA